ncbi:hypothetical protein VPH35_020154 [Triticum aestivum]
MAATSPQLSLPPQAGSPLRLHRRREGSHSPHYSQPLHIESVAEVPEDLLELGMVAGRGTKADAEARDSSPSDRWPWKSCVATSAPGAFLSISFVDSSHHPVHATALHPALPRYGSSAAVAGPLLPSKCKPAPLDDLLPTSAFISAYFISPLPTSANP